MQFFGEAQSNNHLYQRELNTVMSETLGPALLHYDGKMGQSEHFLQEGSKTILIYMMIPKYKKLFFATPLLT
jgi:hypothetical protein